MEKTDTNVYYVYRYIRKDTNTPFYVGKGKGNRAYVVHTGRNKYFKHIIDYTFYRVEFILKGLSEKEAHIKERYFIALYKSYGYCEANFTDGGEGCSGYKQSKETIKKRVKNMYGHTFNVGRKTSEETKRKLSNIMKTKEFSESHKKAISKALTGKRLKEETKKKLSDIVKCNEQNNQRLRVMAKTAPCKKVIDTVSGIIYNSATEAALSLGMNKTTLICMLNGNRKNKTTLRYK